VADQPRKTVDSYIAALDPERRAIAEALRSAIVAAEPGAKESIKWGQPVYDVNGPFVALKSFPRWVTLTFWRGAALADSHGILEGDGDRMRHARFSSSDSIDVDAVQALVREAAAMNRELGDPTKRS
jgi:hypothetical protein